MFGLSKLRKRRERMYANCLLLEKTANKTRQQYVKQTCQAAASPKGLLAGFAVGFTSNCGTTQDGHYQLVKSVQKELFQLIQQGLLIKAAEASQELTDDHSEEAISE
jgi:hypothetical protein